MKYPFQIRAFRKRWLLGSFRFQLYLIVLLAFVPSLAMAIQHDLDSRGRAREEARQNMLEIAGDISAIQNYQISSAYDVLSVVERVRATPYYAHLTCDDLLTELTNSNGNFNFLGVVSPQGILQCSSTPRIYPEFLTGQEWYHHVVRTKTFTTGDYVIGRMSGKPAVTLAYPSVDPDGHLRSILVAGLDLSWMNNVIDQKQLPEGSELALLNNSGTVLAHFPDPEAWIGEQARNSAVLESILDGSEGELQEMKGLDGKKRFYTCLSLPDKEGNSSLYLVMGIALDQVYAEADANLYRSLGMLIAVSVISLFLAVIMTNSFVLRPIGGMIKAAEKISRGKFSARANESLCVGEISDLMRAFNDMASFLERHHHHSLQIEDTLRREASHDALTGLSNWRELRRDLEARFSAGQGAPVFSYLMVDLDYFKRINDTYGHLAGDAVLRELGARLRANLRETDLAARYGGDEFAVVVDLDQDEAVRLAERLRQAIAEKTFSIPRDGRLVAEIRVTVSIGVGQARPGSESVDEYLQSVDQALYESKHQGRNRVAARVASTFMQA